MKVIRILIVVVSLQASSYVTAQVAINTDGSNPDGSAILETKSNSKGLLLPRMTTDQRDAISSPATSLIIYNTDDSQLEIYDGTAWSPVLMESCAPGQPGTITGNTSPCEGQSGLNYSIVAITYATSYHWTVPTDATIISGQGTTAIIMDAGAQSGNISVRSESGCGNSEYRNLAISIIPNLSPPGSISGETLVDDNAIGESYSIATVSGATSYTWGVPADAIITDGQGTTDITVHFGTASGDISVYAVNSCDTSDTTTLAVQVFGCGDVFIDVVNNNKNYNTVLIGTQCWFAENLNAIKYNDNTSIPCVPGNPDWENLTTPGYCWYNNDSATYGGTYGALYNWYAADTNILCPAGWHVPSDTEWETLVTYLGGENVAGGKLKESDTANWSPPNTGATNESGFTALPGGMRLGGFFMSMGDYCLLWSATEKNDNTAYYRMLFYLTVVVERNYVGKNAGYSVRCLKD